MSTQCVIGMRTYDHRIKAVYCTRNAPFIEFSNILLKSYKDVFKVNQLLDKGNISTLESQIKITKFYKDSQPGIDNDYVIVKTWEDLFEYFDTCEYFYIFENDYWTVSTGSYFANLANTMKEIENV